MALSVKKARLLSELSQEQIAEKLNVHRQTYMKWEQNPDDMTVKKAKEFCVIVGIPFDEIFFSRESTLSRQSHTV
ncbi:helix-turn-helix transcriptional regulator [Dehalobacter restrictus]|uniref:helix-turn-helix transcriptional regulator n=1 Tax=Dehalobacter restrictus TaxID=55583 RepID=UPI00338EA23E